MDNARSSLRLRSSRSHNGHRFARPRIPSELNQVIRHHLKDFRPSDLLHAFRARLTDSEQDVLCAYLHGPSMSGAAGRLGTSTQTVRNQLVSIRRKLNVKTIPELIAKVLLAIVAHQFEENG